MNPEHPELPAGLAKIYWVDQAYQTNPLSHQPGGGEIIIELTDKRVMGYRNIKSGSAYCEEIVARLAELKSTNELYNINHSTLMNLSNGSISSIYIRLPIYKEPGTFWPFDMIWKSYLSLLTPWKGIKQYEDQAWKRKKFTRNDINSDPGHKLFDNSLNIKCSYPGCDNSPVALGPGVQYCPEHSNLGDQ